ncbi:TPA: hypothetical protein UMB92_004300 [Stenotrophomonas maltophilia]|nr:hypothetical protein [Stenotrophomonas maltophilia]HEL2981392.1 hypothetical protein [Stenotrophomonas maltophilia]
MSRLFRRRRIRAVRYPDLLLIMERNPAMALWPTLLAHSDCPEKFEELMIRGIELHSITASAKPGHFIVHGPKADAELDALAKRAGIRISYSEFDYSDLDQES